MKQYFIFIGLFMLFNMAISQTFIPESIINSNNTPNIGPGYLPGDMTIDKNQNLWVVNHSGLNRFDGMVWHSYPRVLDGTSWYIHPDLHENIWVGTFWNDGLIARFDGANWFWDLQTFVTGFANAPDSSVWIGHLFGLKKYKNGMYINCSDSAGYPPNVDNYTMAVDSAGIVWMGGEYGLLSFDGHIFTNYGLAEGMPLGLVEWIEFDGLGRMWALSGDQLGRWDGNNWKLYGPQDGLLADRDKICNDGTGKIWVLSFDSARVNYIQGDSLTEYVLPYMDGEIVTDVKCDLQNNLWFSIRARGVLKVNPDGEYTLYQGNSINDSRNIEFDNEETLWISNFGGISSLDKNGEWTFRNLSTGFFTNKFDGMCKDDSILHFSYYDGLVSYNGREWVHDTAFPAKLPMGLYLDQDKRLWTGSKENGAYYRDSTGWHHLDNSGTYPYVECIMQDHSKNMWFGSYNWDTKRARITSYHENEFTQYEMDPYIFTARSILEDKNHQLWAATVFDLLKLTNGEWKVQEIVINNIEYVNAGFLSIYEDTRGWLWVGNYNGTLCFKNECWFFYEFHAPPDMAVITMDITEDKNGHMYFGTQNYGVYRMEIIDDVAVIEPFKIQAGPNPAADYIRVYLPAGDTKALMQVWDMNGKCLLTEYCNENVYHLNLAGFLPGVYLLKTEQGGKTYDYKFVKK